MPEPPEFAGVGVTPVPPLEAVMPWFCEEEAILLHLSEWLFAFPVLASLMLLGCFGVQGKSRGWFGALRFDVGVGP